jgi:hypothetical protein
VVCPGFRAYRWQNIRADSNASSNWHCGNQARGLSCETSGMGMGKGVHNIPEDDKMAYGAAYGTDCTDNTMAFVTACAKEGSSLPVYGESSA